MCWASIINIICMTGTLILPSTGLWLLMVNTSVVIIPTVDSGDVSVSNPTYIKMIHPHFWFYRDFWSMPIVKCSDAVRMFKNSYITNCLPLQFANISNETCVLSIDYNFMRVWVNSLCLLAPYGGSALCCTYIYIATTCLHFIRSKGIFFHCLILISVVTNLCRAALKASTKTL